MGIVGWLFTAAVFAMPEPARSPSLASAPEIRVRLAAGISVLSLRGMDLKTHDGRWLGHHFKTDCAKRPPKKTIEWESQTGFVSWLREGERQILRGKVRLTPQCDLVNSVPIEKYLEGLVNAEFSSQWAAQGVKAQIVAARTYAYAKWLKARGRSTREYDVESTVKDQVYGGFGLEDTKAARLVAETRGLVLVPRSPTQSIHPIPAYYHSTCGGRTEQAQELWGGARSSVVPCRGCGTSPKFHWSTLIPIHELEQMVGNSRPISMHEPIVIAERTETGRVRWIKWGRVKFRAADLRNRFGPLRIQSTRFELGIQMDSNGRPQLEVRGVGYGHGVGMCQFGAKAMGERGVPFKDILSHYYPEARVRKLW